jgi:hypothetical protein
MILASTSVAQAKEALTGIRFGRVEGSKAAGLRRYARAAYQDYLTRGIVRQAEPGRAALIVPDAANPSRVTVKVSMNRSRTTQEASYRGSAKAPERFPMDSAPGVRELVEPGSKTHLTVHRIPGSWNSGEKEIALRWHGGVIDVIQVRNRRFAYDDAWRVGPYRWLEDIYVGGVVTGALARPATREERMVTSPQMASEVQRVAPEQREELKAFLRGQLGFRGEIRF